MHYDELLRRMEAGMSNQVPAGGGGRGNHQKDAFTIARLPPHVREANRSLYEPTVVSIGPYHMSSSSTLAMKAHKWDMLRDFLRRGDPDGKAGLLAACIKAVRAMEPRARRCYGQIPALGGDDLVELLVLDGCFILQFLLEWSESIMQGSSIYVYYDLLLVENQMPLFVLAKLFSLVMGSAAAAAEDSDVDQRLLQLIFGFFSLREPLWQVPAPPPAGPQFTQAYHLLHLQYQRIVMTPEHRRLRPLRRLGTSLYSIPTGIASFIRRPVTGTMTPLAIPCVTALQEEFGVTFKEKLSPASQFDVTFRRGTMEIPRLVINGGTRILLANLFALEQTKDCWNEGTMTGYLVLMNALVNTGADVAVLQRHGIMDNMLSNEDEAAAFFNQLGGSALFDPRKHRYAQLFKDTNEHCNSRWNRYMAVLKRDHLKTPCSIINLLVAAILLFISVMSAGYLICRYKHACT
uniref:Uncharacterized protein n=1 Tax=Avena sativa TaxID=4498 RepID=A0ACD5XUJ5_AVESA